jgi:transposase-like protein
MKTTESGTQRWERLLREHRNSGLRIAEFCRRRGVSQPSFFAWRRRLRCGSTFVEVKVAAPAAPEPAAASEAGAALEVVLGGGRRVLVRRGFDAQLLGELVAALEARP